MHAIGTILQAAILTRKVHEWGVSGCAALGAGYHREDHRTYHRELWLNLELK